MKETESKFGIEMKRERRSPDVEAKLKVLNLLLCNIAQEIPRHQNGGAVCDSLE